MLLVAAGGVVGALARWAVVLLLPHEAGDWDWATLVVNALGAALLCALLTAVRDREVRLLLGTGVLGAFTTFSALALAPVLMVDEGRPLLALAYAVVAVGSLLLAGLAGRTAGRAVRR